MSGEELKGIERGKFDDKIWFGEHADRMYRIRAPFDDECDREFKSLGDHEKDRRRIITFRHPMGLMPIPFLLFSDETIENTDAILGPIFEDMMGAAAASYGIKNPRRR